MRFAFVPSDLLRSCASFIAFSFRRPVSQGTQTFQFVRPAEFYSAETAPEAGAGRIPAELTGNRPVFCFTVPKPPSRGTQTFHLCGSNPAKIGESLIYLILVVASKNRAGLLGQNEPREEE